MSRAYLQIFNTFQFLDLISVCRSLFQICDAYEMSLCPQCTNIPRFASVLPTMVTALKWKINP